MSPIQGHADRKNFQNRVASREAIVMHLSKHGGRVGSLSSRHVTVCQKPVPLRGGGRLRRSQMQPPGRQESTLQVPNCQKGYGLHVPEARHLNLTCISGFEATGVERTLQSVPLTTMSSQIIFVRRSSTVKEARHVDAAHTLLRGNVCKRLNRSRRQGRSGRRGRRQGDHECRANLRSESRRSHLTPHP